MRVKILDPQGGKYKPHICDYIREDDGTELIETIDNKHRVKRILLSDFMNELGKARSMRI